MCNQQSKLTTRKGADMLVVPACSWSLSAASNHSRSESSSNLRSWNYTINVPPGGISRVAVTAVESQVSTAYSGILNITLDSNYMLAIPVDGFYDGQNTSPIVRYLADPPLQAKKSQLAFQKLILKQRQPFL